MSKLTGAQIATLLIVLGASLLLMPDLSGASGLFKTHQRVDCTVTVQNPIFKSPLLDKASCTRVQGSCLSSALGLFAIPGFQDSTTLSYKFTESTISESIDITETSSKETTRRLCTDDPTITITLFDSEDHQLDRRVVVVR